MNTEQPIIVGLDIGTTKIAVIAGRKNEFGKLEILGFGKANSNGVKHGQVLNIDETIKAIKTALDNCFASNPNLDINDVYVGIAGHHIKSLQTRGDIVRQDTNEEITQREIEFLTYTCTELTYKEIGEKMFCSGRTVESYRDSLFEKLGVKTRVALALYAVKTGLHKL